MLGAVFAGQRGQHLGAGVAVTQMPGMVGPSVIGPQLRNMTISRKASAVNGLRAESWPDQAKLMLARYYGNTITMRFLTVDPAFKPAKYLSNAQRWNRYTYALNNPLSYFDPDGREECTIQFRAFIAQPSVLGFAGDNRSFSAAPDAASRVSVTVKVETDPGVNQGNPMIGSPQVAVSPTRFNLTGGEQTATGPMMPQATATQDPGGGDVTVGIDMNVQNPYAPVGGGIRSDVGINISQDASAASISGSISGSPSFEANITCGSGPTQNVPLQSEAQGGVAFGVNLQLTNTIETKVEIKK